MRWVLIIWFSSQANHAYIPVVVGDYSDIERCQSAGKAFVEQAYYRQPRFACIAKH